MWSAGVILMPWELSMDVLTVLSLNKETYEHIFSSLECSSQLFYSNI